MVPWLIKHAAAQITRYRVRAEGKTSYQLIKGRKCIEPVAEFGECVLFRPLKTQHETRFKNSWSGKYEHGVYLGNCIKTSETLIGTNHGVYRAGDVKRRPIEERWSRQALDSVKGCPQQPVPGQGRAIPTYVWPELRGGEKSDGPTQFAPPPAAPATTEPRIRPLYVRKEDVMEHGPTPNALAVDA